jgi:hypothetical protein
MFPQTRDTSRGDVFCLVEVVSVAAQRFPKDVYFAPMNARLNSDYVMCRYLPCPCGNVNPCCVYLLYCIVVTNFIMQA